jgi:hypothetical protein
MITQLSKDILTYQAGDIDQLSDRRLYVAIKTLMQEMIEDNETHLPEFKTVWRDLEAVKNRHGGNPPPQTI